MAGLMDRSAVVLLDAGLAAVAVAGLVALAMVLTRQPARRVVWARAGLVAVAVAWPLALVRPIHRVDLAGMAGSFWWPTRSVGPTDGEPSGTAAAMTVARWAGRGLAVGYLGVTGLALGRVGLGVLGTAGLIRRSRRPSTAVQEEWDRLVRPADRAAWSGPRLRVANRLGRPVLLGLLRPTILIPDAWDTATPGDVLRLALLHELAHIEAGDHRAAGLLMLAQAAWPWLPTVRWIGRQLRLDQEFLADHRAVADFGTSGRYAALLVDLADSPGRSPRRDVGEPDPGATGAARLVGPGRSGSMLPDRVAMLLRRPWPIEVAPPRWWAGLAIGGVGLATTLAATLTLGGLVVAIDGREHRPHRPTIRFAMARLIVGPGRAQDGPFELRVGLPTTCTMTFDLRAESGELAGVEVLGHRLRELGPPHPDGDGPGRWHRVQIRRSNGREEVTVDGQNSCHPATVASSTPWFTIRPMPGATVQVRDLMIAE